MTGPRRTEPAMPDVLVIGGGLIGLACAWELARGGLSVEVVERDRPGGGASAAAGGMLAPLAEVPVPGPFADACRAARDRWRDWAERLGREEIGYDDSGALVVARDDGEERWLDRLLAGAASCGETAVAVPLAEVRRQVPDLAPSVRRALHLPGDHRVDNAAAAAAVAAAARAAGARITRGVRVTAVAPLAVDGAPSAILDGKSGPPAGAPLRVEGVAAARAWSREAAAVVVAAGAWSGDLGGLPPLPVRPVRGEILHLAGVDWPWTGIVRAGHRYAVRRGDGLLFGATQEEAGFAAGPTLGGVAALAADALALFPPLAGRPLGVRAGLRPGTPDDLPLVGPVPGLPGVWVATGHFRNGILLAPWTAERLAAALTGSPSPELAPFSPARFLGR